MAAENIVLSLASSAFQSSAIEDPGPQIPDNEPGSASGVSGSQPEPQIVDVDVDQMEQPILG